MFLSIAVISAVFVGTASAVYFMAAWLSPRDPELERRLVDLQAKPAAAMADPSVSRLAGWSKRLVPSGDSEREAQRSRFARAGFYGASPISAFYLVRFVLTATPPVAALVVSPFGLLDPIWLSVGGFAFGALGMTLPGLWLDRQVRRRQATIRRSMSDFLDLAVICVDAGLSVQATIQRISDELADLHPILARELSIVLRDIELGISIEAALRRFADRSGEETVRSLATLARESQRFGSPLSEALRTMSETLRLQRELSAEEAAQKAAVKILMPTMLLIFPAVFVVLAGPAAIQIQEAFAK